MKNNLFLDTKEKAHGRWLFILSDLAFALTAAVQRCPRHVPCPIHGGKDGFRLFRDAPQTGGGICNTCGSFPNGFSLLQWVNGWSFSETFQSVSAWLGEVGLPFSPSRTSSLPWQASRDQAAQERKRQAIQKVWNESLPADHPSAFPLRAYLESRSLRDLRPVPAALRFHPSLPYYENQKCLGDYPAMIAPVKNLAGKMLSLHRTYLTVEGRKAKVPSPKKLMSSSESIQGCSIQLFKADQTLAVAEGIETALAIYLATGMPVWAAISAGNLQRLSVPETVRTVFIGADLDRSGAGEKSARILAGKLLREGIDARIVRIEQEIPPQAKGLDWLDIWERRIAS